MKRNQRGIALLTALFALMLITGIGLGMLYMTDTENLVNNNYRSSQQSYFAAMAGLQSARERMRPTNTGAHLITPPLVAPGNANSILYLVNPTSNADVIQPWLATNAYQDLQLQTEMTGAGLAFPQPAGNMMPVVNEDTPAAIVNTPQAMGYKWVRIMQKVNGATAPYYNHGSANGGGVTQTTPICWAQSLNGGNYAEMSASDLGAANCITGPGSDPPPYTQVYELTAYANVGGSSRYLQMEVAQDPPLQTHGAVDSQDHVNLNGSLTVNGYDYCTCSCTTDKKGNTTCTNRVTGAIAPTCDGTHYAIYSAATVQNPNNSETLVAGTNPPVVQNQTWTWDVNSLYQKYSSQPGAVNVTTSPYNWSCSPGCGTQAGATLGVPPTFPPSPANNPTGPANMASQVTIVPGDLQLTGGSVGNGVLVVNGNLDIHGGLNFYGVIIVTGVISFTGGGSSATNIFGAVIAGQQSYVDNTLGGSANIDFDYCALPGNVQNFPPRILNLRDISN